MTLPFLTTSAVWLKWDLQNNFFYIQTEKQSLSIRKRYLFKIGFQSHIPVKTLIKTTLPAA